MIIGDTMEKESLNQYFIYENDISDLSDIFYTLSKKLKIIHDQEVKVSAINGDSIFLDDDLSFPNLERMTNYELDTRENNLALAKIILGAYISIPTKYMDYSRVENEWFVNNLDNIRQSISAPNFSYDYFNGLFNGTNEYYCDYIDNMNQSKALNEKGDSLRKVISNAASSFYRETVIDDEPIDVEERKASLNPFFYPIMIGIVLIILGVISIVLKTMK